MNAPKVLWTTMGAFMAGRGYTHRILDERAHVGDVLAGWEHDLLAFETPRSYVGRRTFLARRNPPFSRITVVPQLPARGVVLNLANLLADAVVFAWVAGRSRPRYVYAQGIRAAVVPMLLPFISRRVVLDLHGLHVEECLMSGAYAPRSAAHRLDALIERFVIARAQRVVVVSERMASILKERYGRSRGIHLIPCCYDQKRFRFCERARAEVRRELGFEHEVVFVYSGSFAAWQRIDGVLELFDAFRRRRQDGRLLILSGDDPAQVRVEAERRGIPPRLISFRKVPFADMYRYLSAGDVAVLLRASSPVNDVSAPTKFAEYLACGLPVLISEGVGDYSGVTRAAGLGRVIGDHEFTEAPRLVDEILSSGARERCIEYARANLTWRGIAARYSEVFA